jgi:hypothetical protein
VVYSHLLYIQVCPPVCPRLAPKARESHTHLPFDPLEWMANERLDNRGPEFAVNDNSMPVNELPGSATPGRGRLTRHTDYKPPRHVADQLDVVRLRVQIAANCSHSQQYIERSEDLRNGYSEPVGLSWVDSE